MAIALTIILLFLLKRGYGSFVFARYLSRSFLDLFAPRMEPKNGTRNAFFAILHMIFF